MNCPICSSHNDSSVNSCHFCGADLLHVVALTMKKGTDDERYTSPRWECRFIANFIDLGLLILVLLPSIFLSLEEKRIVGTEATLFLSVLLFVFQMAFLIHDQQTIGKKIMGLAIVCNKTGDEPRIAQLLLMRHIFPWTLYCIPFVAPFILLANGIFFCITRQRGLHDILSNTEVVKA